MPHLKDTARNDVLTRPVDDHVSQKSLTTHLFSEEKKNFTASTSLHHRCSGSTASLKNSRSSELESECIALPVAHDASRLPRSSTSSLLILYTLGLLVSSCGNAVFFKKMTSAMPNYGWFLTQVTCFAYVPVFGSVVFAAILRNSITRDMRGIPTHKFAIMGLLDGLSCLMGIVGGAFTSGPAQLVLTQAAIPVTLMISAVFLHERYDALQYIGAAVIIVGLFISRLPWLWPSVQFQFTGAPTTHDVPLFNLIFTAAAIPGAASQVYKELAFKYHHLNVHYMQFWVSIYQLIVGIIIAPLNALPLLGPQRIPLMEMPHMLVGGFKCLVLGTNTITENCGSDPNLPLCDTCSGAWIPVVVYLVFNVAYNVFILLIVKHGGAALSFVVATLRFPLTTVLFYMHSVMGADTVQPHLCDFEGLVLLIVGLLLYRHGAIKCQKGHKETCDAIINSEMRFSSDEDHDKKDTTFDDQVYHALQEEDGDGTCCGFTLRDNFVSSTVPVL